MCASAANFYVCQSLGISTSTVAARSCQENSLAYNVIKLSKKIMKLNAYKHAHESSRLGWAMKMNALFFIQALI